MESRLSKTKDAVSGYAFDDDTSDSDDEDLNKFRNQMNSLEKLNAVQSNTNMSEITGSNASSEDSDSDSDMEDDDSDDSELNIDSSTKLAPNQISKLSNLQAQLAQINDVSDSSEEEIESTDNESETIDSTTSTLRLTVSEETSEDKESSTSALNSVAFEEKDVNPGKETNGAVNEDLERLKYREKLSKMSIEDIQKLKEKLGLKLFHQKLSGTAPERGKKRFFKRDNKNRPREMSSKKTVGRFREVVQVAKVQKRDPRFDPLCGEFDEKLFKDNYKFVNEIKSQDLAFLKKQIKEEEDPERRKSIKYLIQRTENQLRQEAINKVKEQKVAEEKNEKKEQLKAGVKPIYVSKSKLKEKELVSQYEKLKESGGLDSYIKKKTKKNLAKDRKKFQNL